MTQFPLPLPRVIGFAAEDFIVSECNRTAYEWVMRWPDWPAYALIITGPHGSGKTHLSAIWQARAAEGRVIEDFEAMEEEALFHLLDAAKLGRDSLLLTSACPPEQWRFSLPDVRSRIAALPKARLGEPDEALLNALLAKLFSDRQLSVPKEVPPFLAARMERSFAAAHALVEVLDAASLARGRNITLALARELLGSLGIGDCGD